VRLSHPEEHHGLCWLEALPPPIFSNGPSPSRSEEFNAALGCRMHVPARTLL
jgi:hypothetical protein